jgi:HEPN domain-containing protein
MTRPLFVEVGSDAERTDEWSYPKGIMFGGMAELAIGDERAFAEQYFVGAEAIADLVSRNEVADYTVQFPLCYMYRHSIELYIKCLLSRQGRAFQRVHSLEALSDKVETLPPWVRSRIAELHELDPKSVLLRYGGRQCVFDGEHWCEITFLRDAMRCLRAYFVAELDGADYVGSLHFCDHVLV